MLDDLAERTQLSDSARDYHAQRHAIISAYADSRAYFSAALIPNNQSRGIKFGDSAIQKELAPAPLQAIYPLCQLALSQAVASAQEEYARRIWRATWPLSVFPVQPGVALGRAQSKQTNAPVYRIETRYAEVLTGIDIRIEAKNSLISDYAEYTESHYVPTTVTRVRVLAKPETVITLLDPTKLLPDPRARETVDHGVTPEQFADIESALRADTIAPVESTRAHMDATLALTTPAQLEPSENNYLIATRNLSNETVTVTSAKTARQADYMAGQIHRAHPNTSSMVLSRVQARAARLDTLIAEYAAKHPEEYTSHVS